MKKRWLVFDENGNHEECKNKSEAITFLRFHKDYKYASFTTATKNFSVPIHINKKMAMKAILIEGEYTLPDGMKYGREWI